MSWFCLYWMCCCEVLLSYILLLPCVYSAKHLAVKNDFQSWSTHTLLKFRVAMRLRAVYSAHFSLTTTSVLGVLGTGWAAKPREEEEAKQLEGMQWEVSTRLQECWMHFGVPASPWNLLTRVHFAEIINACPKSKSHGVELAWSWTGDCYLLLPIAPPCIKLNYREVWGTPCCQSKRGFTVMAASWEAKTAALLLF